MAVPYTFGSATTSIPLSQLDSNFATTITLGNTAIQLGNTVTTLNNMTLANVTVSGGNATLSNVTASNVVLSGSTSGTTTLQATAVAGTTTATLPAATGTVMVSGNMPAFSAYLSSNQSVSNATYTKAQINTEIFDTNSYYDNSTNYRFTPLIAGYYQVNACVALDSTTGNPTFGRTAIYKNGTNYATSTMSASASAVNTLSPMVSTVIYLNGSTDYLEVYGLTQGATGPLFYVNGTILYTHFSASLVRAA